MIMKNKKNLKLKTLKEDIFNARIKYLERIKRFNIKNKIKCIFET